MSDWARATYGDPCRECGYAWDLDPDDAAALGPARPITTYDADLLATARRYADVPLAGALWSLGRATADWRDAVTAASTAGVVLDHPDRGPQTVADVVRTNAHDVHHHVWDVTRSR